MDLNKHLPREPMRKVYVCSPYRPSKEDPIEAEGERYRNIERAQIACSFLSKLGMVPIAPHLFFPQFLDDDNEYERKLGMLLGRELLCGCDELWVFGERISEGMEAEIKQAKASDIPVRYCDEPEILAYKLCDIFENINQMFNEKRRDSLARMTPELSEEYGIPFIQVFKTLTEFSKRQKEEVLHEK